MSDKQSVIVVGVRFSKVGKVYHFDVLDIPDIRLNDAVIVETTRGWQLGQVAQIIDNVDALPKVKRKAIDRKATPRDLLLRQMWQQKEADVVSNCREKLAKMNLEGVKIVSAEFSFDGTRLTVHVCSKSEEKIDLKYLRQDIQKQYSPALVEIRQIGPRDAAKIMGGMGTCGLETRCCSRFLTDFCSISIRMAKEQGISLTPPEITGMCGRLRCCLIYEYDHYVELRQGLPKRNKWVATPLGEGKVVDVAPLRQTVYVEIPDVGVREIDMSDIKVVDSNEQAKKKP